jgi:hypothetical protein
MFIWLILPWLRLPEVCLIIGQIWLGLSKCNVFVRGPNKSLFWPFGSNFSPNNIFKLKYTLFIKLLRGPDIGPLTLLTPVPYPYLKDSGNEWVLIPELKKTKKTVRITVFTQTHKLKLIICVVIKFCLLTYLNIVTTKREIIINILEFFLSKPNPRFRKSNWS